jgi:hypothetical protein
MKVARGSRSIETIQDEITEARQARREFARAQRGPFPEDLHEQVEQRRREAEGLVDRTLASVHPELGGVPALESAPGYPSLLNVAAAWALAHDERLAAKLHATIDALPASAWPSLPKAEVESRLGSFDERIAELEGELQQARKAAALSEVEAQFA